jgi:hypothetical protein
MFLSDSIDFKEKNPETQSLNDPPAPRVTVDKQELRFNIISGVVEPHLLYYHILS